MKKYRCPFKQYELVVWEGEDPTYTFNSNESVLFLERFYRCLGIVLLQQHNGKVIYGFHTDNFRKAKEDEI
jgi:hypothetical protein